MDAKELMERGWKAREAHDFVEAEKLLLQAKELFEQQGDWFNVTECLNHLAYSHKIQATLHADKGRQLAEDSLELAGSKGTKTVHAYRALMSLLVSQANFEEEYIYAQKCLELYNKPMNRGDVISHLALCALRRGDSQKALSLSAESLDLLNTHWEEEEEPHRSIWKISALLTRGLVLYNRGLLKESRALGKEALTMAREINNPTRILQAKNFLRLFQSSRP